MISQRNLRMHHHSMMIQLYFKFHEIPCSSYREMAPDRKCDGRTDGRKDGQTDGRTDGQRQNNIPPPSAGDKKGTLRKAHIFILIE